MWPREGMESMRRSKGEWSWRNEIAQKSAHHASASSLESSGSAVIIRFIAVNLKELGCQFERKNSKLNTRIDIFLKNHCKYIPVSFFSRVEGTDKCR